MVPSLSANRQPQISLSPRKSVQRSTRTDQCTGWQVLEAPINERYKHTQIFLSPRKSLQHISKTDQCTEQRKLEAPINGRYRKRNHNRSDGGYRYHPHMPKAYSVLAKSTIRGR